MRSLVAMMIAGAVLVANGQEVIRPAGFSNPRQLPPEREKRVQEMGGWVSSPATGNVVRIVNAQTKVSADVVVAIAASIQDTIRLPIEVVQYKGNVLAEACFGEKTCAVVLVGESGPSITVAPEDHWATVNICKLLVDQPDKERQESRTRKEIWRATAMVLGAADSVFQPCLMRQISTLQDLDSAPETPCPEPFNKIMVTARKLGCTSPLRAPYKHACEQGWAPAPTNELQRIIWNSVKSDKERGPTNPIKIPPPGRDKR